MPTNCFQSEDTSDGFGPGVRDAEDCPRMTPGAQSKNAARNRGNSWKGNVSRDFAAVLIALTGLLRSICVYLVRSRCLLEAVRYDSREQYFLRDTNVAGLSPCRIAETSEAQERRCSSDLSSSCALKDRNVCCTT